MNEDDKNKICCDFAAYLILIGLRRFTPFHLHSLYFFLYLLQQLQFAIFDEFEYEFTE